MKVKISNFQSIEEVELEIDGFTAIVGRSNIGKSSIVRAIDGALSNKEGDNFVREGADHTEVEIECPEIDLLWRKGGGYNDYVIDGEVLENVGRGAPPQVQEAGFRNIRTDRADINVQVASQFSPIFLIDPSKTSGSVAAEIISDIGRLSELQEALRNCSSDRRSLENTVRVREEDLEDVREELKTYDNFEEDMKHVEEIKTQHSDIGDLRDELNDLKDFKTEKKEVNDTIDHYDGLRDIDVPEWSHGQLVEELNGLETLQDEIVSQKAIVENYDGIRDIDIPELEVEAVLKQLRTFLEFRRHVESAKEDVEKCQGVEDIDISDTDDIDELVEECRTLQSIQQVHRDLQDEIPTLEKEIEDLDQEIEDAHDHIHEVIVEAGECPTCGKEVGDE